MIDQLCSAAALVGLVLATGHGPDWTVPLLGVLFSLTRPLSMGSFLSALAELVGQDLLDRASAIEATSLNLAFIVGPALAGILAGAAGPAAAIDVEAAATLAVALLVAVNPAFEARPQRLAARTRDAMSEGITALVRHPVLRAVGLTSGLATAGWGMTAVGFPLLAARNLHAGANSAGYLWAALAAGSIIGTFAVAGGPSLKRSAASYAALGLSALLWQQATTLTEGILAVGLTGVLEGPAYSASIALRQRLAPERVRAQVMTTMNGFTILTFSAGAALAGAIGSVGTVVGLFLALNLLAALLAAWAARSSR